MRILLTACLITITMCRLRDTTVKEEGEGKRRVLTKEECLKVYRDLEEYLTDKSHLENTNDTNPFGAKLIIYPGQEEVDEEKKIHADSGTGDIDGSQMGENYIQPGDFDSSYFDDSVPEDTLSGVSDKESRGNIVNEGDDEAITPGAAMLLTRTGIDVIRDRLVPYLMDLFTNFKIDAKVDSDSIKMTNIKASLTKLDKKNMTFVMLPNENAFYLKIKKPSVYINADLEVNKVLSMSGSIEVVVRVVEITVKVFFIPEEGKQLMKPKIRLELVLFDLPKDEITVSVDLNYVPNWLTNMIIFFVKGDLLTQVKDLVKKFVPGDLCDILNKLIQEGYPEELPIIMDDVRLPILLTRAPVVTPSQVHFFLDGYIYSVKKGKSETRRKASPLTLYTPSSPSNVSLSVSDETLSSFVTTFLKSEYENKFEIISEGNTKLTILTNLEPGMITINGENMIASGLEVVVDSQISGTPVKYRMKADLGMMLNYLDFDAGELNFSVNSLDVIELVLESEFEAIKNNEEYFKNLFVSSITLLKNFTYKFGAVQFPLYIDLSKLLITPKKGFAYIRTSLSFYG